MQEVTFRPATKRDCRTIASLYSISSDGVADYIWTKLAIPGQEILEVGQARYEREDTHFSYRNCTIAEFDSRIAGMLVAFPMHIDSQVAMPDDPVLRPYAMLEEDDSYYICGIAVFPEFRGNRVGAGLLEFAERQARKTGYIKTSLVVFEQNGQARQWYERHGYLVVKRAAIVPHPLIHYNGDALLMVKKLT